MYYKRFFNRGNRRGLIGAAILVAVVMLAVLAPSAAPFDPHHQNLDRRLLPPGSVHLLGTDALGRDIWSRIVYGSRYSLAIGAASVGIGLVIGAGLGLLAGYKTGVTDLVVMRLIDILMAFPGILIALVLIAVLGTGFFNLVLSIGIFSVPQYCRIVRSEVLSLRERDFVLSAQAVGASEARIMWRHVLPNALSQMIVLSTLRMASAILLAASLGFLGLGLPPDVPEWGMMLNHGRQYLRTAPHLSISPGVAIALTVLSINLVGDMLRDILDPRHVPGS